ncbi:MAG TPA: hypothetical protein VK806_06745, partial [Bacteroidia bacterium]|nr:hypothetical protein [Bacteroidia bacterium]
MRHVYRFTRLSLAIIFFIGINTSSKAQVFHTVAGNGTTGYSGDTGPALSAELNSPEGVAVDKSGNVFVADYGNNVIRKIAAGTGIVTTVAGTGIGGYYGDGGAATSAELYYPSGIAIDKTGNLYIADTYNQRIRKVATGTGIITTVAGLGSQGYSNDGGAATSAELNYPIAVAVDTITGIFYISDQNNYRVRKVSAGIITTVAG